MRSPLENAAVFVYNISCIIVGYILTTENDRYNTAKDEKETTRMKTEQIVVTSKGLGIEEALTLTEKLGNEVGLERKPMLHLRLLAEELFGMLRRRR